MKFNLRVAFLTSATSDDTMRHLPEDAAVAIQHDVRAHYGWSYASDLTSAQGLRETCNHHPMAEALGWSKGARERTLERLATRIAEADHVVLVGAAVSVSDLEHTWQKNTVFIAADGAVGACFDRVEVLCVVTDLDGGEHLDEAVRRGIPLIVHAHGDNQALWERHTEAWAQRGGGPLVLTHQTDEAFPDMHNVGGFTDGDRAACFLVALGVSPERVRFVGYAVDHVGPWSGTTDPVRKLDKLKWMERVLDLLKFRWRDHPEAS